MIATLRSYRAERLPFRLLATVSTLLAVAAQLAGRPTFFHLANDAGLALLLFVLCRGLDDLADRDVDRLRHPGRVLVGAPSIVPFATALALLAVVVLAILAVRRAAWPIGITFVALLAIAGRWPMGAWPHSVAGDHVALTKYPVIVWIITTSGQEMPLDEASPRLVLALAATYLTACVYEALHDAASPAARRPALLAVEGLLLVMVLTALSIRGLA